MATKNLKELNTRAFRVNKSLRKCLATMVFIGFQTLQLNAQVLEEINLNAVVQRLKIIEAPEWEAPESFGEHYRKHLYLTEKPITIVTYEGDTTSGYFLYNLKTEILENPSSGRLYPFNVVRYFTLKEGSKESRFSNLTEFNPKSKFGGFVLDWDCSKNIKTKFQLSFESYEGSVDGFQKFNGKVNIIEKTLIKVQDRIIELPEHKNELIDLFPNVRQRLKKFIRSNKLRIQKKEDLCQIVDWLSKNEN